MNKQLTFPIQVARFASLRYFVPLLLIALILTTAITVGILRMANFRPIAYWVANIPTIAGFGLWLYFVDKVKATNILIGQESILVMPVSCFGFGLGEPIKYELNDFQSINVENSPGLMTQYGYLPTTYRLAFIRKDGGDKIIFDAPNNTANPTAIEFARELGRTLNIKVNENARD